MIERGRGSGLRSQSSDSRRVMGEMRWENFQRDFTPEAVVPGTVHLSHGSGTQRGNDLVTAECSPDASAPGLGRQRRDLPYHALRREEIPAAIARLEQGFDLP